ncbi:MAG: HAD-superfamily hydrolase, subfamily, partial [Haloplasmataceae bacterium]|jgi:Cof subfamily protein (haloacid dehalogenase superfamily)|nr:HAD-superfamily hydrolase, subfamily [Haloplasmataceae bacterium]
MDKYLIVIDLDGTTLTSNKTIHEITKNSIKKLKQLGHTIVIATGRSLSGSIKYYHELELDTFIITRNGAFVYSPIIKEIMMMIDIPKKSINELLYGHINEYINEIYIESKDEFFILKGKSKEVKQLTNQNDLKNITTCKLMLQKDKLEYILNYLNSLSDIIYDYWNYNDQIILLEIYPKLADKSIALGFIADYYHISHKNIIAIGDGNNDIKMIKNAHVGVAVKNATESLKRNADIVLDYTNNEGAVGLFLNDFFKLS